MDDYQYSKILDQNTIRLILLQPSPDLEAELRCSLVQASLEELEDDITEHYVALSYVWGDPTLSCAALVDGRRVRITPSLDCALRYLRQPYRILRLWADGICINQNDIKDGNQQVRLMGSVYTWAQHTIIFLGPSDHEADLVIHYIAAQKESKSQTASSGAGTFPDELNALLESKILNHSWFTRVWVLQELILSRDPWVQYGKARVRWDLSCKFAHSDSNRGHTTSKTSSAAGMNQLRKIYRRDTASITQNLNPAPSEALLNILFTRRGAGVTDPRDMVYGHLGLLDRPTVPPIEIDYGRSVAEVYEDIARCYIKYRGLSFLKFIEDIELEDRRDGLPSWIPDWTLHSNALPSDKHFYAKNSEPHQTECYFPSTFPHTLFVDVNYYGHILYLLESPYSSGTFSVQFGDQGPSTYFPQHFEEQLWFGPLDPGGKFVKPPTQSTLRQRLKLGLPNIGRKPSTSNSFKERITEFKPKHTPETIYDVHKLICA